MVWFSNAIWIPPDSPTIWIPDKWTPSSFSMYWFGIQMVGLVHRTNHLNTQPIWNPNFIKPPLYLSITFLGKSYLLIAKIRTLCTTLIFWGIWNPQSRNIAEVAFPRFRGANADAKIRKVWHSLVGIETICDFAHTCCEAPRQPTINVP